MGKRTSKADRLAQAMAGLQDAIQDAPDEGQSEAWHPTLSPTQLKAYYDERPIVELDGERGSGKSHVGLSKFVRHCYRSNNAMALLLVVVKSAGQMGGAWEKLHTPARTSTGVPLGVLESWRDDVGLEFTEPRVDTSKNEYIDITNAYGNRCRIYYKSLPPGETIEGRTKGIEASIVMIDEYNNSPDATRHITKLMQQLGRRPGVEYLDQNGKWQKTPQQLILCGNPPELGPDDPSFNLLFIDLPKKFNRDPIGAKQGDKGVFLHNNDPMVGRWHIPMHENMWMENKEQYLANLQIEIAQDPSAEDRLIKGIWRKKLTGQGIFKRYWTPEIHVKPTPGTDYHVNAGLRPIPPDPIIVGYDPGDANNARIFMQLNRLRGGRYLWRIFDEIVDTDTSLSVPTKVRDLMERRVRWNTAMKYNFVYHDIADQQALNRYNPQGNYEYKVFEDLSREMIHTEDRYKDLTPVKMEAPPKGAGSVAERVKLIRNLLMQEAIWVSKTCTHTIDMFAYLKKAKDRQGKEDEFKPERSKHIHVFDALSYPIYYYFLNDYENSGGEEIELVSTSINI